MEKNIKGRIIETFLSEKERHHFSCVSKKLLLKTKTKGFH